MCIYVFMYFFVVRRPKKKVKNQRLCHLKNKPVVKPRSRCVMLTTWIVFTDGSGGHGGEPAML